jgi:hypothetical protein
MRPLGGLPALQDLILLLVGYLADYCIWYLLGAAIVIFTLTISWLTYYILIILNANYNTYHHLTKDQIYSFR